MVFLSNYLVFKIVLAALGRTDYPVAGDLELKYDNANKVYLSGGSLDYIDDFTLWTTIGEETSSYDSVESLNLDISNEKILLADDRDTNTQLGYGCDIDGDYMIGGGPQDDEGGSQAGAAYIFKRSAGSWKQTAKLVASDAAANDQAAEFCEISGDYAIFGVYSKNSNTGAAYIFKRDTGAETWSQQAKLTASDAASSDYFGWGVSIDGDYAIVGAFGEDTGAGQVGAAYIFKRSGTTWSEEAKIQASNNDTSGDYFGYDVTISGDYAAAGAIYEDTTATHAGSVYIFKRSGTSWTQQQQIQSSDIASNDNFGAAVAMDGDYLAVSSPYDNSNYGAIYFFKKDAGAETWTQQTKIIPSGVASNDQAGNIGRLSISGDIVVAGADLHDSGGMSDSGTAWVFKRSGATWSEVKKLSASDAVASDRFGISVGVSGNTVLVGAAYNDVDGVTHAGALYVYDSQLIKNYYINEVGKYSADVTIAGLKYKTNEVDVTSLNIPAKVVGISAGSAQVAALTEDGSVYMWGTGSEGRLGQGSSDTNNKNTPVQVKGVDGVGFLSNIKQISCGGTQTFALANDGTLYAWGSNSEGQLGVGDTTARYYPTVVPYSGEAISKVCAVHKHSLLCTVTNGYVYACGENQSGQVGNGSSGTDIESFTQVLAGDGPSDDGKISGITHLSGGNDFSMILNATTGLAYGFGRGNESQLSTGDQTSTNSTPRNVKTGGSSTNLTNIADISCGEDFSYFLIDDGTVYASGEGSAGEQGDGANSDNTSASACTGLSNIVDILGTKTCGFARKSDGTLYVWGDNTHGQFANGSETSGDTHTPTAITSITGVEDIQSYGRGSHLIARKSDGSVWCWGEGTTGQIGNGVDSNASSPTQVIPGAGPSVDGKFNLFTSPRLSFDGYNKLSIYHGLKSLSSSLFHSSNTYNIGALSSDLIIETPGLYKSLTYDTLSSAAYFDKTTVSAIASTKKNYDKQDQILTADRNAGYTEGGGNDPSQGGYGNSIDMSADGTRMVVGNGHYAANSNGRIWLYHLESGSWVLKQTWDGDTSYFGSQVAMNEAGTRAFAVRPTGASSTVRIWNYSSGAWDTSASGTYSITVGTMSTELCAIDCNKAGDVIIIGSGSSTKTWVYRLSGGSWSEDKEFSRPGAGVAMNGDGTRCFMGHATDHKVWESNYSGGSWGTETEIISESGVSASRWPASLSTDSAGETLCIVNNDAHDGAIYERASNGSWSASVSGIKTKTEIYGTDKAGISYDGTMVLFGHMWNTGALSTGGHALLYTKSGSTWSIAQTLLNPSDSQHSADYFGGGVALAKTSKDRFVVAALGDDNAGTNYGAIYTYSSAIPDYISYDTYNKLTLSGITGTTSKIHALPTGAESTTIYDIGTATNMYIESAGTYTAEMKGSSAFALDSNVVTGTVTESPIKQVCSGGMVSMALTNDGYVYVWGYDTHGQMGQGTTDTNVNTPVKVKGVDGSGFLSNITKISCSNHCLALASDGTLYSWGINDYGELGDASTTERKTPVVVSYSGDPVSNISAGVSFSALSTTTGKVYCWGLNNSGQIGDNTNNNRSTPTQVVGVGNVGTLAGIRDVSCGDGFIHAIKDSDGSVYGWGKQQYGMIGNGQNSSSTKTPTSVILAGGSAVTGIIQVGGGGDYSLFLKSDGTVYAAGYGASGQLGDGATDNNDTGLVQVLGVGGSGNLTGITQIAALESHSLALKSDGTMYSWGTNNDGQNGLGTVGGTNPTTPVEITLLTGVDTIGGEGKGYNFIASKSDGSVYCWGRGDFGQIGDGTNTADQGTPTQVLAGAGPSDGGYFNLNTAPRLKFDGLNKYTFSGADTGSTYKLKYLSNTYDLGTTSKVYINNAGTYSGEIKGATNFALVSNVVSGTVSFPSRTSYRYLALGISRNQYENCLENMIIEFDDGTKYDNANQPASSAFTENYAPSTGATTDVFSTSQNTNWNGNSLGWNDGTWYCPFHIDFGSGFTKKVKRVTIINRIDDYQYSLIVPRLYGASSVPSTPGLAANWNYVCHVESIQKGWTSTLTSYDMEPKAYRYIGLAGYRTVYSMHVYEFSIELVDGTVYDSSNKPTVSSDLSVSGGSVANTIDGDWTNNANWNNASSHTSASQQYVYLKVDLGSAKKVKHVRVWNQYTGTYTNGTNSMNYYGSSTNTSSTDAEGSSDWNRLGPIEMLKSNDATEKTINSSLYDSKLEFDTYNKLSLSTFDPTSTKLTSGENTYDIGTATNIYITENGTYDAEVTSASALALTSKAVGTVSSKPSILPILKFENLGTSLASNVSGVNLVSEGSNTAPSYDSTNNAIQTANPSSLLCDFSSVRTSTTSDLAVVFETYYDGASGLTAVVTLGEYSSNPNTDFSIDQRSSMGGTIGGLSIHGKAYVTDTSISGGTYKVTANLDAGDYKDKWSKHALVHYEKDAWWYIYVNGEWKLHMSSSQTTTSEVQNWFSDGFPSKIRVFAYPGQYTTGGESTGTKVRNIEIYDDVSFIVSPPADPSLTFDGYKLVLKNTDSGATTNVDFESNTYDIGTATNVYIKDVGTYKTQTKGSTNFALLSNVSSGTIKTVTPGIASRYYGKMALTYDGKLYAWGENSEGEAGVGTTSDITVPTLCTGITQGTIAKLLSDSELTDGTRGQVSAIKTTDGKIHMAGKGDNNCIPGVTSDQTSFTDVTSYFGDQSLTANTVTMMSFTDRSGAALTETGNVWTWGTHDSTYKALGQASASSSSTPKQINFSSATGNITQITSGAYHNLALDSSGDVWFWGKNNINSDSWPSSITDEPQKVVDGKNIIGLASGYGTMYAWDATGKMWNAGNNWEGQIGDGTTTTNTTGKTLTEVTYFSSKNITINKVYGGGYFTFANTSDGYYCWGNGGHGVFGNGSTGSLTSGPVKWTHVSNIKKFVASTQSTAAITEDGKYYAWGKDGSGERGDSDSSSDISYPKYIDALPNILAPSFEFDGYDKVFVNKPGHIYDFYSAALPGSGSEQFEWTEISSTSVTLTSSMFTVHKTMGNSNNISVVLDGDTSESGGSNNISNSDLAVGNKIFTIQTPKPLENVSISAHRIKLMPGWEIRYNGLTVYKDTSSYGTGDTPSPYTTTIQLPITTTKFTKNTIEYDVGKASTVTVSDTGTYDAQLTQGGVFALKSTTLPATKTSGLYTWAFHHGNFDNAYGDGDILTARDNGRFYADTPAYTGDIGTITPVSQLESVNVSFKLNQYTQGSSSDTNTTGIMLTEIDVFDDTNTAMTYGTDYRADLYRAAFADNSQDGGTGKLSDETTPYNDDGSRLNDNTLHGSGGYIGWVNGTYDASATSINRKYPYAVDDELIRLVPLTGKIIGKVQFAYKGTGTTPGWKVYRGTTLVETTNYAGTDTSTQGNQTTHQIVDAKSSTTYTFAPPSGGLTANVMMVAGGGGGGGRYSCGGGGAGGLVYTAGTSLASGSTKTIVVGNGDSGGLGDSENGFNGKDTTFTGLTSAVGGGAGGTQGAAGATGGSGGGGGGATGNGAGGSATSSQGNAGGTGSNSGNHGGGGGGGSGAAGSNGGNGIGGNGGTGKFFGTGSSFTNFGDEYGEGGWFASGGGGGAQNSTFEMGFPGRGGGGYGQGYSGYAAKGGSQHGMVHTGGGGGGSGTVDRDGHPGHAGNGAGYVTAHGGRGGSGIVLIQTNVAPPNGANTAVVQVGNPRRRSLLPAVDNMGSEVNRWYIIDGQSMPTYRLPTHWYGDPISAGGYEVPTTQGSHSLQKRADGGTSNVWYASSAHYFADYGTKMAQSADAVFMPLEAQRYDVLLSIGANAAHDIQLEMAADGTAKLYRNNGANLLQAGTIKCFTVGKWHHIALTVDSEHNAVGYVNGYPVVSATYTSNPDVGSRTGNMHLRVGVTATFRKFLTYEVSTYNFHMSPKQVMQRAAEVGCGPKLEHDGLNTLKILNTEPGSTVRLFTSNVADTSNVFVVADPADSEYTIPEPGKYYAEIKGTDTFTITKTLDVSGTFPLYQYPPVVTGTKSSLTTSLSADTWNTWTMSGASTGNGQYQAKTSHTTNAPGGTHACSAGLFTNLAKIQTITEGGTTHYGFLHTNTTSNFDITLQLPSAKIIRKYVLYPADTNAPVSTPGGSVDPTLPGNGSEENTRRPKSWVLKGSNNGSDWTTIHTVTNKPPSIYGDVHTISSPASYLYYMLSISANNGSSSNIQFAEWQLWGDA